VNAVVKRVEVEIDRLVGKTGVFIIRIFYIETGSLHVKPLKIIILFLRIDIFLDIIVLACLLVLLQC
jgi:hypothetical protein